MLNFAVSKVKGMARFPKKTLIVLGAIIVSYAIVCYSSIPPSDIYLERQFFHHRDDMSRLLLMADQDKQVTTIAPDFAVGNSRPPSKLEISSQRLHEYRSLLERAGIRHGLDQDRENSSDVSFLVWTWGILMTHATYAEYVHCGPPDTHNPNRDPPCLERKDAGSVENKDRRYHYTRATDDWFVYVWSK